MVGILRYLTNRTRPNLTYSVGALGRFAQNPSSQYLEAAKRVIRYYKATSRIGIIYSKTGQTSAVTGYLDSDYAGDRDTRKSTSSIVFILAGGTVS